METNDSKVLVRNEGKQAQRCGPYTIRAKQEMWVPLSFFSAFSGVPGLRFDFSHWGNKLETFTSDGKFTFDYWCPLSGLDGYGRHAIDLYRGFKEVGVEPVLRDVGWFANDMLASDIRDQRNNNYSKVSRKIGLSFTIGYDPRLYDHGSPIKVALTQFETTRVPHTHVDAVNKTNHLIVTSSFGRDVFRDSGVIVPIDVMVPGINTDTFAYKQRPKDGLFKCLIIGGLTGRKNPLGAIKIFQDASDGNPDWRLTIKTRNAVGVQFLRKVVAHDPRINLIIEDTPAHLILSFYYNHDVLLWPSKGEGVGLPVLEAMSTGMEVVSSNNSGLADFVNDKSAWVIRNAGMEPANQPGGFSDDYVKAFGEVGDWWVPDLSHGAKQLQKCFDAWYKGKGKGEQAAEYVRRHHTLMHQAQSVVDVLEEIAGV